MIDRDYDQTIQLYAPHPWDYVPDREQERASKRLSLDELAILRGQAETSLAESPLLSEPVKIALGSLISAIDYLIESYRQEDQTCLAS